jgi:hypothetical protein
MASSSVSALPPPPTPPPPPPAVSSSNTDVEAIQMEPIIDARPPSPVPAKGEEKKTRKKAAAKKEVQKRSPFVKLAYICCYTAGVLLLLLLALMTLTLGAFIYVEKEGGVECRLTIGCRPDNPIDLTGGWCARPETNNRLTVVSLFFLVTKN